MTKKNIVRLLPLLFVTFSMFSCYGMGLNTLYIPGDPSISQAVDCSSEAATKISTAQELAAMGSETYCLTKDITIKDWRTKGEFSGTFYGQNKTIKITTIQGNSFIDTIVQRGQFKDVNIDIESINATGSLATLARQNDGQISNVSIKITNQLTSTNDIGGFVHTNNGTITNSKVSISKIHAKKGTRNIVVIGGFAAINKGNLNGVALQRHPNSSSNLPLISAESNIADSLVGGLVGENFGTMKDLSVENISVEGTGNIGGLVGSNQGKISLISVKIDKVSGSGNVGGLVGHNTNEIATVTLSLNSLIGSGNVGGLVGKNSGRSINNCNVNVQMISRNVTYSDIDAIGGLVGHNSGDITKSNVSYVNIAYPNVSGPVSGGNMGSIPTFIWSMPAHIGGLVGSQVGGKIKTSKAQGKIDIKESYNPSRSYSPTSTQSGSSYIGGFVGKNHNDNTIEESYSAVDIDYKRGYLYIGGFAGASTDNTKITNAYSTGNLKGKGSSVRSYYIGGFTGLFSGASLSHAYTNSIITDTSTSYSKIQGDFAGLLATNGALTKCYTRESANQNVRPQYGITSIKVGTNGKPHSTQKWTQLPKAKWNIKPGTWPTLVNNP